MYSYKKEKKFPKRKLLLSLSCLFVATVAYFGYQYSAMNEKDTTVFKDQSIPVLKLPNTVVEKGNQPFKVKAITALEYFDGKESKIENMTKFEGVYRTNQGIDYTFNKEAFEVMPIFSGSVSEVKEDSVLGKSIIIKSKDIQITYQSVQDVRVKKDDQVHVGEVIATAGENIYNKDLGNHLHVVVENKGKIIDPKTVYDKAIGEIK